MTACQADLFGCAPIVAPTDAAVPGLEVSPDFLSEDEETALLGSVAAETLAPFKFQQWEGKRLTASFGWGYDFTTGRLGAAAPFPGWLLPIRDRAARFAGVQADALVQALLIRYDPGAGIGWHKDRPVFDEVIGISLGSAATLRLRQRRAGGFNRAKAQLPPRSIYHLTGDARHRWEHSIAPIDTPRWSITLRSLA